MNGERRERFIVTRQMMQEKHFPPTPLTKKAFRRIRRKAFFTSKVAGAGFEVPPENKGEIVVCDRGGADSGALGAPDAMPEPELATVVNAWPMLPEAVRVAILAMIQLAK